MVEGLVSSERRTKSRSLVASLVAAVKCTASQAQILRVALTLGYLLLASAFEFRRQLSPSSSNCLYGRALLGEVNFGMKDRGFASQQSS